MKKKNKLHSSKVSFWKRINLGIKELSREVLINYLANVSEIVITWVIGNWKTVFIPLILFILGLIIKFARRTFLFTGGQIIISLGIFTIFILVVFNVPKIRKWILHRKENYFFYKKFHWKYQQDKPDALVGPFCANCGKQMDIVEENLNSAMGKTIDEMFGMEIIHVSPCAWCDTEVEHKLSLSELEKEALEYYLSHIRQ